MCVSFCSASRIRSRIISCRNFLDPDSTVAKRHVSVFRILTKAKQFAFSRGALKSKAAPKCDLRFYMLREQDSNLRPIDYTYPIITEWGGLYHHRCWYMTVQGASNVLRHSTPRGDSLWTFNQITLKAWLLIALGLTVGVPAIHLVFNIDFSIRLLF